MKKYLFLCLTIIAIAFLLLRYVSFNENEYKVFKNAVSPTPTNLIGFALGDDGPFLAVNLLKFKEKAEYEDGRLTTLSGQEAYSIYANEVQNHLAKVGAKVKQGEIIAYVGDSGRATGTHLHFEFWQGTKRTDPVKVQLPSAQPISKEELDKFLSELGISLQKLAEYNQTDNA